jgi:hypothetical protein
MVFVPILCDFLMVSTAHLLFFFQIFKWVQCILLAGGDGVSFPFNPVVGDCFSISHCRASCLAVPPLHGSRLILFFIVFYSFNRL